MGLKLVGKFSHTNRPQQNRATTSAQTSPPSPTPHPPTHLDVSIGEEDVVEDVSSEEFRVLINPCCQLVQLLP